MKKILISITMMLLIYTSGLNADETFFTYIGGMAGGGLNKIKYTDWFVDRINTDTINVSGSFYSGGVIIDIFVKRLIGEFSIQYINNPINEASYISVKHLIFNTTGKYSFQLAEPFCLTSGLGLYFETPPSNRSYGNGAGFNAALGMIYNIRREWKIIFDIIGRYPRCF